MSITHFEYFNIAGALVIIDECSKFVLFLFVIITIIY